MERAAVFLDRDGVIVHNRDDYIKSLDEVDYLPGVFGALRYLNRALTDTAIVIVTNQSAVERGIISWSHAQAINRQVVAAIEDAGGRIDACYMCPHRPDQHCECRKPAPGMLLAAAKELGLRLPRSYLVGDAVSDLEAAAAVGAQGILVLTGRGKAQSLLLAEHADVSACSVVGDLSEAIEYIISQMRSEQGSRP